MVAMGTNNCDSMSSYFANSYMPDLRNGGGVVPLVEHAPHHQHYGATAQVGGGDIAGGDPNNCDPTAVGLRQGIPAHHYGPPSGAGQQPAQGMPYPRFPPYDRMDIRSAAYYGAQQQQMVDGGGGYRPDSPGQMGHANGHQTPVVYASCKLQAAAVAQGGVLGSHGSPPLEQQHQAHHMQQQQHQAHQAHHMQQQAHHMQQQPPMHQPPPQQHMMYGGVQGLSPQHQTHQQPMHQAAQQQPPSNTAASLPSPLYPWMRSQFGE